jgi:hypothetical protein
MIRIKGTASSVFSREPEDEDVAVASLDGSEPFILGSRSRM